MPRTTLAGLLLVLVSGIVCPGADVVTGPLVVSDHWPECTDLRTWFRDVIRIEGLENASGTARGKALFEWLRLFNRMATGGMIQAYEGAYSKESYVLDLHKNLFVYGWGYCDTHSRIAEGAWQEATGDPSSAERVVTLHENGGYHTMYRLRLDGRWAAFDARYGYYLIAEDSPTARVLDWAEVGHDANIIANRSYKHRSRPFFEFFGVEWDRALAVNPCYYPDEPAWIKAGRPVECAFGNGIFQIGARYHDMRFRLLKGTRIERFWDNSARMFYVPAGRHTAREEPFLASGRFYRVTESMFDKNWPNHDPNHVRAKPYLATVPRNEGYNAQVAGGRTIGQAWGRITYEPDVRDPEFAQALAGGGLDLYSPYVLVEGTLEGELANPGLLEMRTLQAKPRHASEEDVWSPWQKLHDGGGRFHLLLGRARYNGKDASLHGVYRFQLRLTRRSADVSATLKALKVTAWFENGIMSLPQIFDRINVIRVKLDDASLLRGPMRVTYHYQTRDGERVHRKDLAPRDFSGNEAVYQLDARGLVRANSVAIEY